jgi:phenylacetate-coenzyme A ligase PaaK-like adenylate-forming protein
MRDGARRGSRDARRGGLAGDELSYCGTKVCRAVVEAALRNVPGLGSEYQLVLSDEDGIPTLTLKVEAGPDVDHGLHRGLAGSAGEAFRKAVGRSAWVEVLAPGTLDGEHLYEGRRIVDARIVENHQP